MVFIYLKKMSNKTTLSEWNEWKERSSKMCDRLLGLELRRRQRLNYRIGLEAMEDIRYMFETKSKNKMTNCQKRRFVCNIVFWSVYTTLVVYWLYKMITD